MNPPCASPHRLRFSPAPKEFKDGSQPKTSRIGDERTPYGHTRTAHGQNGQQADTERTLGGQEESPFARASHQSARRFPATMEGLPRKTCPLEREKHESGHSFPAPSNRLCPSLPTARCPLPTTQATYLPNQNPARYNHKPHRGSNSKTAYCTPGRSGP
jgi:hypothetical protein